MIKRLLQLVIIAILGTLSLGGYAWGATENAFSEEDIIQAAPYLAASYQSLEEDDPSPRVYETFDSVDFAIGQGIYVYALENNVPRYNGVRMWPFFNGGCVTAVITSCDSEDGKTLSFSTSMIEGIREFALNDKAISVVFDGSSCLVCTENECWILQQSGLLEPIGRYFDQDLLEYTAVKPLFSASPSNQDTSMFNNELAIQNSENAQADDDGVVSVSKSLDLPALSQGNNPTCWATCVASVGKYLTNVTKDPIDISKAIKGTITGGTDQDTVKALALYSYPPNYSTSVHSVVLPVRYVAFENICNWINNGVPLLAACASSDPNAGHMVVVFGYTHFTGGVTTISIMNPGRGTKEVAVKIPSESYYSFTYNGVTYQWNRTGIVLSGWQIPPSGSEWKYYANTGRVYTGRHVINGLHYGFYSNGNMAHDCWFVDGNGKSYYQNNGAGFINWHMISNKWYYFNPSNAIAVTGWQYINDYWYAFDDSCAMRTGWYQDQGKWYYLIAGTNNSSGPQGAMLRNGTWEIGGKKYTFDSSGACTNR